MGPKILLHSYLSKQSRNSEVDSVNTGLEIPYTPAQKYILGNNIRQNDEFYFAKDIHLMIFDVAGHL